MISKTKKPLLALKLMALLLALLFNPAPIWAEEEQKPADNIPADQNAKDEPIPLENFQGPNANEPTGPYNRSYQWGDPYESYLHSVYFQQSSCENMLVTAQNVNFTTKAKLVLIEINSDIALNFKPFVARNYNRIDDKIKPQLNYVKVNLDSTCSQAFAYKKILLAQLKKETTEVEYNKYKNIIDSKAFNEERTKDSKKVGDFNPALVELFGDVTDEDFILDSALAIENNCRIIKKTPKPFLKFSNFKLEALESRRSLGHGYDWTEISTIPNKDEFSLKNNLDREIVFLKSGVLAKIDQIEHNRMQVERKQVILEAVERAKKTCKYIPPKRKSQKNVQSANIQDNSEPLPLTEAQDRQMVDEAIQFILNPLTDFYSNESTTRERISSEVKAVRLLIQKKEFYLSAVQDLSQIPASTLQSKNHRIKFNRGSAKKTADFKLSTLQSISSYQKWIDYLTFLIERSQKTWAARCNFGFNEDMCESSPWRSRQL